MSSNGRFSLTNTSNIAVDPNGALLIATTRGAYIYDGHALHNYFGNNPPLNKLAQRLFSGVCFQGYYGYFLTAGKIIIVNTKERTIVDSIQLKSVYEILLFEIVDNNITLVEISGNTYKLDTRKKTLTLQGNIGWNLYCHKLNDSTFIAQTSKGQIRIVKPYRKQQLEMLPYQSYSLRYLYDVDGKIKAINFGGQMHLFHDNHKYTSQNASGIVFEYWKKNQIGKNGDNSFYIKRALKVNRHATAFLTNYGIYFVNRKSNYPTLLMACWQMRACAITENGDTILTSENSNIICREKNSYQYRDLGINSASWGMVTSSNKAGVYITTTNNGIYYFDNFSKQVRHLNKTAKTRISGAYRLNHEKLIICSDFLGILNEITEKIDTLYHNPKLTGNIFAAIHDQTGWYIGSKKGLFLLDNDLKKISRLDPSECRWILKNTHPYLLAGLLGKGIARININSKSINGFIKLDEMPEDARRYPYSAISLYSPNKIAVGTIMGLYVINTTLSKANRYKTYNIEFNTSSLSLSENGILLAGGQDGLEFLNPHLQFENTAEQVQPYIISIKKTGRKTNKETMILKSVDRIDFESDVNFISINIGQALDYSIDPFNWRYRIIGLTDEWITVTPPKKTQCVIQLGKLPAGKHQLEVQFKGMQNKWSEPTRIDLYVAQKWYLTTFSIISALILIALITYFSVAYIIYRKGIKIREKNRLLKIDNILKQSQLRLLRNHINPHMIANVMQTIQSFIHTRSKEEAAEFTYQYGTFMRKQLEGGVKEFVSLKEEIEYIEVYSNMEKMKFREPMHFSITTENIHDPESIFIPSMILQPLIENAFKHGGKSPVNNLFEIKLNIIRINPEELNVEISNTTEEEKYDIRLKDISGLGITRKRLKLYRESTDQKRDVRLETEKYKVILKLSIPIFSKNEAEK